jgi:hypothetical protein
MATKSTDEAPGHTFEELQTFRQSIEPGISVNSTSNATFDQLGTATPLNLSRRCSSSISMRTLSAASFRSTSTTSDSRRGGFWRSIGLRDIGLLKLSNRTSQVTEEPQSSPQQSTEISITGNSTSSLEKFRGLLLQFLGPNGNPKGNADTESSDKQIHRNNTQAPPSAEGKTQQPVGSQSQVSSVIYPTRLAVFHRDALVVMDAVNSNI